MSLEKKPDLSELKMIPISCLTKGKFISILHINFSTWYLTKLSIKILSNDHNTLFKDAPHLTNGIFSLSKIGTDD